MPDTLALTIHQPYSSLLAYGITNWLTTAEPPPDGATDAEWLIVSDDECDITEPTVFGDFEVWPPDPPGQRHPNHDTERPLRLYFNGGRPFRDYLSWAPLPLGAVESVARVTDVVPIVDGATAPYEMPRRRTMIYAYEDALTLLVADRHSTDISDQLPYGDWTPGRWAWRMEVRRLTEPVTEYPCPACDGSGGWWLPGDGTSAMEWIACDECMMPTGHTTVPVRGRQGVWRPDPALVAAVMERVT